MMTSTTTTTSAVLSATGLTKRYGDAVALAGVDLTIASGESIAVTGSSGSGKSTLLYCLAGVIRPDVGQVLLDGTRLDEVPERHRTRLRLRRLAHPDELLAIVGHAPDSPTMSHERAGIVGQQCRRPRSPHGRPCPTTTR